MQLYYYNQQYQLVDPKFPEMKWATETPVPEDLQPGENQTIVFDLPVNQWRIQSTLPKDWSQYLIRIGLVKIEPTQKVDENGNIVSKTHKELFEENLVTKEAYIEQLSMTMEPYIKDKMLAGTSYSGYQFRCDEDSVNRVSNAILQASVFPEDITNGWISEYRVDEKLEKIPGSENSVYPISSMTELKALGKVIGDYWKFCFFNRRQILDGLNSKTKEELLSFNLDQEWMGA